MGDSSVDLDSLTGRVFDMATFFKSLKLYNLSLYRGLDFLSDFFILKYKSRGVAVLFRISTSPTSEPGGGCGRDSHPRMWMYQSVYTVQIHHQ